MFIFRKHIPWFKALTLLMVFHLFNYSVNLDDKLLTATGFAHEQNEIESIVELILTQIYQEEGALPDEANDIDESKSAIGFMGLPSHVLDYKSVLIPSPCFDNFFSSASNYSTVVSEITPPPPKVQV